MVDKVSNNVTVDIDRSQDFLDALCRYYSQFLDSDFKATRLPKRQIKLKDPKGRRVGLSLSSFSTFEKKIFDELNTPVKYGYKFTIKKGRYRGTLSKALKDTISLQIEKIRTKDFIDTTEPAILRIINNRTFDGDPELLRETLFEQIKGTFAKIIIAPFLNDLEGYFEKATLNTLNSLIELEDELADLILEPLYDQSSEAITNIMVNGEVDDFILLVSQYFRPETIRNILVEYFSDFSAEDLVDEIREMLNTQLLVENHEFYLYLGEIRYKNTAFPLFYIPLDVSEISGGYALESSPIIYVNKKAISYISGDLRKQNPELPPAIIGDRIIHMDDPSTTVPDEIKEPLNAVLRAFSINADLPFINEVVELKFADLNLNNKPSLALFDKSDESVLNDYEALLTGLEGGGSLKEDFENLINELLLGNPISIEQEIFDQWDSEDLPERLVYDSPIPLAEEQRKILNALNNPKSKFISVEGPPGTGKSHTIAAIAFNQILQHKNVLILSDKQEALNVVENFMNTALSKARVTEDFQNPILRLGIKTSNYSSLLSRSSIQILANNAAAAKKNASVQLKEIDYRRTYLKDKISREKQGYSKLTKSEVNNYFRLRDKLLGEYSDTEIDEFLDDHDIIKLLDQFRTVCEFVAGNYDSLEQSLETFGSDIEGLKNIRDLCEIAQRFSNKSNLLKKYNHLTVESLPQLIPLAREIEEELNKNFFSRLIRGRRNINRLKQRLLDEYGVEQWDAEDGPNQLYEMYEVGEKIRLLLEEKKLTSSYFDYVLYMICSNHSEFWMDEKGLSEAVDSLSDSLESGDSPFDGVDGTFTDWKDTTSSVFLTAKTILDLNAIRLNIANVFQEIPDVDYLGQKQVIETLNAKRFADIIDERIVNFAQNHRADSAVLRKTIRQKSRFPTELFDVLKEAFPCIIASLRDYAEFIPLEKDMFDVLIIDEGSQVSIAQALPSMLRAKKVIVFGDRMQFSNVKTVHASREINNAYIADVMSKFHSQFPDAGTAQGQRARMCDIHSSVMDFFELTSNYSLMLRKHFRSYPELISFSNDNFYKTLQPLKIRTKPISDVIEFRYVEHDGKIDPIENTNKLEAEQIVKNLAELSELENPDSVAVITPHSAQQELISRAVTDHLLGSKIRETLHLAIFTFDTCQGEERDIVMYSMVATRERDKLNHIFPQSIGLNNGGIDHNLRLQRLNVGFSRAKEKIIIFHSKPIEEFNNSIKEALQHYQRTLDDSKDMLDEDDFDPNSPMEKRCYEWITSTPFFHNNRKSLVIKAQFPIGDYLRFLDDTYTHGSYVVDFLLIRRTDESTQTLIVEYDGFQEHFENLSEVDSGNWELYISEADIEREKILESYGYKMLRVNKFNIGSDPVSTLDRKLSNMFGQFSVDNHTPEAIRIHGETVEAISEGKLKHCKKCDEHKPIKSFESDTAKSGYGHHCKQCRSKSARKTPVTRTRKSKQSTKASAYSNQRPTLAQLTAKAPLCSVSNHGKMKVRTNRQSGDKFYGCSHYPWCKATWPIKK